MKFDEIRARWQGYSARKKWTIAGIAAVLCIAAASGDHNDRRGRYGDGGTADTMEYATAKSEPRYQAQPGDAGVYGSPGYAGGGPTGDPAPIDGSTGVMSGWQHNQDVQDRAAKAFDQNIRDESTIRSTGDGQTYSGVSNPVADDAVQSGAAVQVPTAELPTSTTTTAPE